jgi:hypothetical protein
MSEPTAQLLLQVYRARLRSAEDGLIPRAPDVVAGMRRLVSGLSLLAPGVRIALEVQPLRTLFRVADTGELVGEVNFPGVRRCFADDACIEEKNVPERFRHLIPYAKYWSIGDDVERGELMARTSLARKKELVDAVLPQWDELHAWCDAWHDAHPVPQPVPDEIALFEMLFEPVAEAKCEVYPEPWPEPPPPTPEQEADAEAVIDSLISLLQNPFPDAPDGLIPELAQVRALGDKLAAKRKKATNSQGGANHSAPGGAEPDASPNGGPGTQSGNSGASEGPPSVS